MRKANRIIVWPAYLDLGKTRQQGRLVPRELSVKGPRISEIARAADRLGLSPEVEEGKSHPTAWQDRSGYVTVMNLGPKTDILRRLGAELVKMRGK